MAISVFDLFKIGIGPSSSHTVGPMKAARLFALGLEGEDLLERTAVVDVELFGSLGATGRGHGSDKAVLLGLEGHTPEAVPIELIEPRLAEIRSSGTLRLLGRHAIPFAERQAVHMRRTSLPWHPNGMRFSAFDAAGDRLSSHIYYSVGGGFVVNGEQAGESGMDDESALPYPFETGDELLALCTRNHLTIAKLMLENEKSWCSAFETRRKLLEIWGVMQACVERGIRGGGVLPGGMKVRRRAAELYARLSARGEPTLNDPLTVLDWVNMFAMAVNEENAAGGRVVTAPTNGAAGIIPAVLHYYTRFVPGANEDGVVRFLLTAGAIGILYKKNASISGADVGCQGEVGVACSMAAAGLAEVCGGTPAQVENAAEIGMEHNLGLTCDPVGGLVQIPCIERNAMGSMKAINACRLALSGDGRHHVSLDKVIKTMRDTGADMKSKYKETARGGLAVNVIEC